MGWRSFSLGAFLATASCATTEGSPELRLIHALWKDDVAGVNAALRHGADPNITLGVAYGIRPDPESRTTSTPLFLAAERRSPLGVFEALLVAGADPDRTNERGETPLSLLFWDEKQAETALMLVAAMRDLSGKVYAGCVVSDDSPLRTSYLHAAVRHPRVFKALAGKGMDIHARDSSGQTPLHLAVRSKTSETARFLLEKGADPHAKDHRGRTPFYWTTRADFVSHWVEALLSGKLPPEDAARHVKVALATAEEPGGEEDIELQCLLRSAASRAR